MANTYLTWTPSNSGTRAKWTFSAWVKKGETTANGTLFFSGGSNSDYSKILLQSSGKLYISEVGGGSTIWEIQTNRLFRDASAFYHIVIVYDSGQGTASNRVKIYVNGVQETSLSATSYPAQNRGAQWLAGGQQHRIGRDYISQYFGGVMSHINFSDGYALAPTVFGSTDSTTGEWKINTSPSFTLGTYGFTILKDGSTITDQSSNSNNWSLGGGTLTNTKDCPSNVMATMNPLAKFKSGAGITQGNNTVTMTTAKAGVPSTLGIPSDKGKFYAEFKMTRLAADSRFHFGLLPFECLEADDPVNAANKGIMLSGYNAAIYAGGGNINAFYGGTGRFNSFTGILGIAVDLTSSTKTIAFSKDGAWITGSNATNANYSNALKVNITSYLSISPHWHISVGSGNSSGTTGIYTMNFGNGFFGTTAITTNSGNGYAGAEGASKFNYAVPSGYSALSTKGLNQ